MTLTFRKESPKDVGRAAEIIIEMTKFAFNTKAEAHYEGVDDADIDVSFILKLWTEGTVSVFSAWDGKELVGLYIWLASPGLWRPKKRLLSAVMMHLKKEYRGQGYGSEFLVFCKSELAAHYPKGTALMLQVITGNPHIETFGKLGFAPFLTHLQGVL